MTTETDTLPTTFSNPLEEFLPPCVCSPTDAIERWLPELTMHLATPSTELKQRGLQWSHFPTTGVAIQMADGSLMEFHHAFHVPKEEDPFHIAVFTEEDGCHEMWLDAKCAVNILA